MRNSFSYSKLSPARAKRAGARAVALPRSAGDVVVEHARFLKALCQSPSEVGAVAPSSRFLAQAMVAGLPLAEAETVVEFGPGTGAFTELILGRLGPAARFIAIELNEICVRALRQRLPGVAVYADSAENVSRYLRRHGQKQADYIFSGLPWAGMSPSEQDRILAATVNALKPGGLFTTFGYLPTRWFPSALRLKRLLKARFSRIEVRPIVWLNFPPALVYRCYLGTAPAPR